jgi:hypothetical protein
MIQCEHDDEVVVLRARPYHPRMPRPSDPDRIHAAKRAGIRARMASTWGIGEQHADQLLDEWEAEAERLGQKRTDSTYWSEGEVWMRARIGRHSG